MSTRLTPQQKLRKAIYGSANPTPEQIAEAEARYYEREAAQVTDEEFKAMWGISIDESVHNSMLWAGWFEAILKWHQEHGNERKYHVFHDGRAEFTRKKIVDMVQMFYRQGREDQMNGIEEYDRLWTVNREEKTHGEA